MKLRFVNKFKSIDLFNEVELPEFCVFVGKNGAGKTHILQGLKDGHIIANSIPKEKVTYFNFQSFLINDQRPISARNIEDEKEEAWRNAEGWLLNKQITDDIEKSKKFIRSRNYEAKKVCLIETGIFSSGKKMSEIDRTTFMNYSEYIPDDYELLSSLSEICFEYHKKYILGQLSTELGGQGKSQEELLELEKNSPWAFINDMFQTFGLPHKIKAPQFNAGEIISSGTTPYHAMPIYDDFEFGFQDLSSGERILCALAITVFQDKEKAEFPELLLLDEIDAFLHPSMVKNLLSVINNVFIKNNCKVILATHSPTTVSLVEELGIFEIKPGKVQDKIVKISQTNAIEILSEGMITLEKGLVLFDQISSKPLSIITEGDNIAHLEKAISLLKPELLEKIDLVKGIEGNSGKDQLKTLFDFFKLVNHTNSVLFVLDCDVNTSSKTEGNKTFLYSLPLNTTNGLTSKGIENIYNEGLFDGFVLVQTDSHGVETKKFDLKRKKDFTGKIIASTSGNDFINYQPLIDKIISILE